MMELLNEDYWSGRYEKGLTGWDIGYVSTPIKKYIDQLGNQELEILIPGAGNSYEAEYLWQQGFHNIHVMDISPLPLANLQARMPDFPEERLLLADFFDHDDQYDLIIEQTFFCALNPGLRRDYVRKMHDLLRPGGKLVGVLFNIPLFDDHPPFGGNLAAYEPLFRPYFKMNVIEEAYNSIPPRKGNELFINLSPLAL